MMKMSSPEVTMAAPASIDRLISDFLYRSVRALDACNAAAGARLCGSMDDWVLCRVRQKGILPLDGDDHLLPINPPKLPKAAASPTELGGRRHPSAPPKPAKMADKGGGGGGFHIDHQGANFPSSTSYGGGYNPFATHAIDDDEVEGLEDNFFYSARATAVRQLGGGVAAVAAMVNINKEQQPPLEQALNTIKRQLSFGPLDEIMLMNTFKRSNNGAGSSVTIESSPTASTSVDQSFADQFLL